MTSGIYSHAGVWPPITSGGSLQERADNFREVGESADAAATGIDRVVNSVSLANRGAAIDAFVRSVTTGDAAARPRLDELREQAGVTRDAFEVSATTAATARTDMEAVATTAVRALFATIRLPQPQAGVFRRRILDAAKNQLLLLESAGVTEIENAFAAIDLPGPLILSEDQRRGSVPQESQELWDDLGPDERMQWLRNIGEDAMDDMGIPEDERPDIIFYSTEVPQPPGTQPPPIDPQTGQSYDWSGNNGVRRGDELYLNYDLIDDPNPPPEGDSRSDYPTLMSTVVHEAQHYHQGVMQKEYEALSDAEIAYYHQNPDEDPFREHGSTIAEVERMDHDYRNDERYTHQPVEIDARRRGTEYLDDKTGEKLNDLAP